MPATLTPGRFTATAAPAAVSATLLGSKPIVAVAVGTCAVTTPSSRLTSVFAMVTVRSSAEATTLMLPSRRWPSSSSATPSPPKRWRGVLVSVAASTSIERDLPPTTTWRLTAAVPVLRLKPTGPASLTPWMPRTSAMPPAWTA